MGTEDVGQEKHPGPSSASGTSCCDTARTTDLVPDMEAHLEHMVDGLVNQTRAAILGMSNVIMFHLLEVRGSVHTLSCDGSLRQVRLQLVDRPVLSGP